MISIKKPASSEIPSKANILPCRIKYTGPASSSRQLWNPTTQPAAAAASTAAGDSANPGDNAKVETHTSYFRGRKLVGTKLAVPDGYQDAGSASNPPLTGNQKREMLYQGDDDEEDEEDGDIQGKVEWTTKASFEEIMVWGHEVLVDGTQDGVVKGVEEWMGIAKILNGY
ncbi:hypothetical protein AOL_s00006g337 [Orbilia oligospora ATCC 24927]|uniref:Uncharacterized protein n=2 Tax=Orbilia oligospora TaxID=2813651 RepID=G1X0D6_ARTOA|nr:hypothetical protein AOL_s00006g337 [Orbilia oligospora ATCC 24927]EGX53471.1 hypothetical protein AOL_s00006g337 [Orbilia oligospora ATCC 24927]KAF3291318.1 hypothetical protein TWF970_000535 [Orbilia oligospora]